LQRYLASLPRGVESYPEAQVKASVYRDGLDSFDLAREVEGLPEPVAELILDPLPVTAWVPEVHSLSVLLALRDRLFEPGPEGLDRYEHWVFERNLRLLRRPLYRALFLLISPERLLSGVERRWSAFRRGTSARVVASGPGFAEIVISHPPKLYDQTVHRGLAGALRAAAAAAGARGPVAHLAGATDVEVHCTIRF